MSRAEEHFEATGVVRAFAPADEHSETASFYLEVGHLLLPCKAPSSLGASLANGELIRVVGNWVIDVRGLFTIDVNAILSTDGAQQRTSES